MNRARDIAKVALLCTIAVGCGSGGGTLADGGDPRDTGATPGGGTLIWREGGTMHTALYPAAAIARSSQLDFLQISGGDAGVGISFGVAIQPPPLVAGAYACGGTGYPIVSFTYTTADGLAQTCGVDLSAIGFVSGAHVVGTFSASIATSAGASKAITEGHFDIAATVSTL